MKQGALTYKKLHFKEDGRVNGEVVFEKGKSYDVPVETGSVERWLRRGVAEEVKELTKEEKKAQKDAEDKAAKDAADLKAKEEAEKKAAEEAEKAKLSNPAGSGDNKTTTNP